MNASTSRQALAAVLRNPAGFPLPTGAQDVTPQTCARPTLPPGWPQDPRPEAFHGPAGEIALALAPHTEADPIAIHAQILVGFGNLIGRSAHLLIDGTAHYLNEFCVIVGQSSRGRKGTSYSHALNVLKQTDLDWAKNNIASGLSSGEGIISRLADGNGSEDKRLLVKEGEFAKVLRTMGRDGNTLSPVIRDAWDSETLGLLTKTAMVATRAHISVIAHITPDELKDTFTRTEQANGFGNRFLWFCSQRRHLLPHGGSTTVNLQPQLGRLARAAEFARKLSHLDLDEQARELWESVYSTLSDDRPGIVGDLSSRSTAHVKRLSALYAVMDHAGEIKLRHLESALAIWEYCDESIQFIFGGSVGDPTADGLLKMLNETPGGLTRTKLFQTFSNKRTKEQINEALAYLERRNLAYSEKIPTGGRSQEVWISRKAKIRQ
jgi:hypothetical protein